MEHELELTLVFMGKIVKKISCNMSKHVDNRNQRNLLGQF